MEFDRFYDIICEQSAIDKLKKGNSFFRGAKRRVRSLYQKVNGENISEQEVRNIGRGINMGKRYMLEYFSNTLEERTRKQNI